MKRKIKLDVVMKSGVTIRLHVTDYTLTRGSEGEVAGFRWSSDARTGKAPLAINIRNIDAVVRI